MFNKFLIELQNRIVLLFFSFCLNFFICYNYKEIILFVILKPGLNKTSISFIYTELTEILTCYLSLSFFIALNFSLVILFYHFFMFFSPALHKHEYNSFLSTYCFYILNILISTSILNFIILPSSWLFFLTFQNSSIYNWSFETKVYEYVNFYKTIYYLVFFNNFFVYILYYIFTFNNNLNFLIKFRKLFYFLFFFNSTILTPPEISFQFFLGFLQCFFYELFVFFCFIKIRFN